MQKAKRDLPMQKNHETAKGCIPGYSVLYEASSHLQIATMCKALRLNHFLKLLTLLFEQFKLTEKQGHSPHVQKQAFYAVNHSEGLYKLRRAKVMHYQ